MSLVNITQVGSVRVAPPRIGSMPFGRSGPVPALQGLGVNLARAIGDLHDKGLVPTLLQNTWYGRHWNGRRPPGLPEWARGQAMAGDSLRVLATGLSLYSTWPDSPVYNLPLPQQTEFYWVFIRLMAYEARLEIGRPANAFNAAGGKKILAWGFHQFNSYAWPKEHSMPWGYPSEGLAMNPADEILYPLHKYATTYAESYARHGKDGWLGVSLRHSSGGVWRDWMAGKNTEKVREKIAKAVKKDQAGARRLTAVLKEASNA